jgi:hypothetical protein
MKKDKATGRTSFRAAALYAAIGVVALWMLSAGAGPAYATHYRGGHLTWVAADGNTVEFTLQAAWRRSGYSTKSKRCIDPKKLKNVNCSGADGFADVGDVIKEGIGGTMLDPGDGSGLIGSALGPLLFLVTAVDRDSDWLFGEALDPASLPAVDTTISHTYPSPGTYLAFMRGKGRVGQVKPPNYLVNNPWTTYTLETLVDVGSGNSSPKSAMPPIVLCPIDALCLFTVPGSDPDGDPVNFRLSSGIEAAGDGDTFVQPGPPFSTNAASIDPVTGLYSWDTNGAILAPAGFNTMYSTQVTLEDPTSKSSVEFLIELVPEVGVPPVFDTPPTPECGSTQVVELGKSISFTVQASDEDPDQIVTLNAAGIPNGATMTPALPTTDNPVSSVFSWTPSDAFVGVHVVTFSATDNTNQQALCPITIEVARPPSFVTPPSIECGTTKTVEPGETVNFSVQAMDDPDDIVTLDVVGLPAGASMTPPLPTSGNPVSSDFSWTPTVAQVGVHMMSFSATDDTEQQAFCQVTIRVSRPPIFVTPPTPECGTTQVAEVGETLDFTVRASDDPGDVVTLSATGLPAGALMTPPLPISGNPVSSNFSWIPTPAQAGMHTVTFMAVDDTGMEASCLIRIDVPRPPVNTPPFFNIPPTPACGSTQPAYVGEPIGFTVQASDDNLGDLVTLTVAGLPAGATMTPALPTSGNPVSSDFSWTPAADQTGLRIVTYTATDESGLEGTCVIMLDVSRRPGPPECDEAYVLPEFLWPPNHKYRKISIKGVTDPDGGRVDITITGIRQDEPLDGLGDGDTCPDGKGVGSSSAYLRAERSGLGDGRVYHVSFIAKDSEGETCTGTVKICVPHDQGCSKSGFGGGFNLNCGHDWPGCSDGHGFQCVDQGPLFDSTGPCGGQDDGGSDGACGHKDKKKDKGGCMHK